jgi:hydroxymethylpyrimidine/phosphomethylpyrimidine kinase
MSQGQVHFGRITMMRIPRAMTIAGSDSGGGAGIQADLLTFAAYGVFGTAAITAITAQNTVEVRAIHETPAEFVAQQIDAVAEDIGVDAAKTGMLASAATVEVVADRAKMHHMYSLVVDPVLASSSGRPLLNPDALQKLKTVLLPRAHVVTPNLREASLLTGREVRNVSDMKEAAKQIQDLGPRYVVITGGHLETGPVDLLYTVHDFIEYRGERLETNNDHGTGCIFSAAIAACLARGTTVPEAVGDAKAFTAQALQNGLHLGHGSGPARPLHHLPAREL